MVFFESMVFDRFNGLFAVLLGGCGGFHFWVIFH